MKGAVSRRRHPVAIIYGVLLGLSLLASAEVGAEPLTDDQVRDRMIKESIADYPGACPCPYSKKSSGQKCGDSSAYRKPGGDSPLCYPEDISVNQVDKYRKKHKIPEPKPDR